MQKVIAIVGPTASGKTAYGIEMAKKVGGEIINADSRQIYEGFPATTAKPSTEELSTVPHHLIGTHPIDTAISVVEYKALAEAAIADISSRGKVPILVGGTGHWIDAVLYDQQFPEVAPNKKIRERRMQEETLTLYNELAMKDSARAGTLGPHNKKRLVRALEIVDELGEFPAQVIAPLPKGIEIIGIRWPEEVLRKRIERRTDFLLDEMLEEAKAGLASLSDARARELGFDFTLPRSYLRGEFSSKDEFLMRLKAARWQYSRRQMRWFKRNGDIGWREVKNA